MLILLASACTSLKTDDRASPEDSGDSTAPDDTGDYTPPPVEVISLTTEDGVSLAADWYDNAAGSTGLLLLHMIPPSWDRTSWPPDFIESLVDDGFAVLALDRRGAGASGGNAVDAYEGDLGVNDAYAAVDYMVAGGHDRVVVIGASNGTTTLLDYATGAGAAGRPDPDALIFMSGGTYTENNSRLRASTGANLLFIYPSSEAAWNEEQRLNDPGTWSFAEYADGAHGTRMFDAVPTVRDDMRTFLRERLTP